MEAFLSWILAYIDFKIMKFSICEFLGLFSISMASLRCIHRQHTRNDFPLSQRFGQTHPIHRNHHNNSKCFTSSQTICAPNEYAPNDCRFCCVIFNSVARLWSRASHKTDTACSTHKYFRFLCVCRLWYINLFISNLINFIVAVCAALAVYKLHGCTSCGCDFHTYVLIRKYAYFAYWYSY